MVKFAFRWYGPSDAVSLNNIRQIPCVTSVVSACHNIPAGELWNKTDIQKLKDQAAQHGLGFEVVEGMSVHESIKLGTVERDGYIDKYIQNLRLLASEGIQVVCYNFMPVFGWLRTDLDWRLPDSSHTLAFSESRFAQIDPFEADLKLPGWNFSSAKGELGKLIESYRQLGSVGMWRNLQYFLEAVVPEAEKCGIRMAIHPDDPPLPVFGLPRIVSDEDDLARIIGIVDSPSNSITLCTGSLGSGRHNNVTQIAAKFAAAGKISFVHARNIALEGKLDFVETAHPSMCGSLDMSAILKALHDGGFDGYIRADHGRMIWGETGQSGYGLFDRAMGISYLYGLWEGICKESGVGL